MFDVLIRNGKVMDGSGNPWFYGDVAISGDRIAAITFPGRIPEEQAKTEIDATGKAVCPGFIDIQSHSILPLMQDGRCISKITQGITTEIMGETWTPAPHGGKCADLPEEWAERAKEWTRFGDWLDAMVDFGVSPNVGSFLAGATLRSLACGMRMGEATAEELEHQRQILAEAMEDGAFGVAYALIYPPDTYVETDEIVSVCEAMSRYGGVYITHMRSEAKQLLEGLEEALEIGRRANVPVEIYHLKASGRPNWHKMPAVIARINEARAQGQDVTADMYPYAASGTGLATVVPTWVSEGGQFFERLRDAQTRAKIRDEMTSGSPWREPETIMPIGFQKEENAEYVGKRLPEIAQMRKQHWVDAVLDLLASEGQRISTIYFTMSEDNLKLQLQQPWIKISTDAGGHDPDQAKQIGPVHPRSYGTYPRVLGKYVREEKAIALEDAVRKMTSSVADRLGLRNRGRLQAGCFADVVVFDPETVTDRATFEDSHRLSKGVREVFVNGVQVVKDGVHTNATPGRFVKGPGTREK
ncbi:MAG: D-aminoacylase [bacterium]|nr:D-aminoacylase [bacterium]